MKQALLAGLFALTLGAACTADSGLFVAVGDGGRRLTSRDGVAWENDERWSDEAKDHDAALFDVAFGAGRFIAVGGGTQTGHILATRDGRDWRSLQEVKGRVATIVFGHGRFVAGHDAELMFSTTGEKFETGARLDWPGSIHARRSACGDTEAGFRFVIIGDVDLWVERKRVHWRGVTSDGTRWEHAALDAPAASGVAYGAGHFVVVGPGGLVESSHDGQTWQRHETDPAENFSGIVWTGTRFLTSGGTATWSSPDGLNWERLSRAMPDHLAWAREGTVAGRERLFALGFSSGGGIHFSHDFTEWKKTSVPLGPALNAVAFGEP